MAEDSVNVRSTNSSAAKTSPATSKSAWPDPQGDWVPIGRAVFRFGMAGSDGSTPSETPPGGTDLFSRETFEQSRSREGASGINLAKYETKPPSLEDLAKLLQEKTHAREVEIDQEDGRFIFGFDLLGGGASVYGVTPWVLLAMPEAPLAIDPRVEAEALFDKEGLVRISDEDAEYEAQQNRAVREATGLVWRQHMLRAFDRSVAEGRVKLYARVQSPLAPFLQLPKDLWARLDVVEWQHGVARDSEGTVYYSLHADDSSQKTSAAQSNIVADESAATKALAAELKRNTGMSREQASSWCKANKYQISDRGFLNRVWPEARIKAGLPLRASPGRKRKSTR
jgi:hypothetical protein